MFKTFDLEKFFDKESLIETIDNLKKEANLSDKDYKLWFKLVKNRIGQGMFGAALASSLNICCAIDSPFGGEASATMGTMGLNCVIMQDDIAKMNHDLKGAIVWC